MLFWLELLKAVIITHLLLKDNQVHRESIISGYSSYLPFAGSSAQVITNLKQGERVSVLPWFNSDEQAIKYGFARNIFSAKLESVGDSDFSLLYQLIGEALAQAGLKEDSLKENNVRVYMTGIGPRVDVVDYRGFYNYNDMEDINLTPSITNLCVANMSQDSISYHLANKYGLTYLPPNMNCTSNSSLVAVHLSSQAIEQGGIELALIINISKVTLQDMWFLENQSMLDSKIAQPFGVNSKGVMFSEGYSVMLLESSQHRKARGLSYGVSIKSAYKQINAGRGNDAYWQSTNIYKLINKVLNETGVKVEDLCALIPHGNGAAFSDSVEAKVISMLVGEQSLPVLAYKGQIGYTATGSGLVDLIIGHYSLVNGELIMPISNDSIMENIAPHVLIGPGVKKHDKIHLLKTGLGVDGSVIAIILTNMDRRGD